MLPEYEAYYGDSSGVDDELKICRLASIGPFPSSDSESIFSLDTQSDGAKYGAACEDLIKDSQRKAR